MSYQLTPNPQYLDFVPYQPGRSKLPSASKQSPMIVLASNENCYGPSPKALQALLAVAPTIANYPDNDVHALRQQLSEQLHVQPNQLVFGNGSSELIDLITRVYVGPHESVLCGTPAFISYELVAKACGVAIQYVPFDGWNYNLQAMLKAITPSTKLVFLASPNNPTGTYITRLQLEDFLRQVPQHLLVVVDAAYIEYVTALDYPDPLTYVPHFANLLVLRTFSKIHGLAGLRLGYVCGQAPLVDYLNRARLPFAVNALVQTAGCASLMDVAYLQQVAFKNAQERQRLHLGLQALGLEVVPSQGNFLLVGFGRPAADIEQNLRHKGICVRSLEPYKLFHHLRVTIGTKSDNDAFLAALTNILENYL